MGDLVKRPEVDNTEDTYCLGAQYWSKTPHVPGYHADLGILLDMASSKGAGFLRRAGGILPFNAGWVQDKVWSNAAQLRL